MLRAILIRFAIPTLVAVSILAIFGVPYVNRMLSQWFRDDVTMRAQLVVNSMETPLAGLVARDNEAQLRKYLNTITADQRLLAVMLCRNDGSQIFKTERTPKAVTCNSSRQIDDGNSRILQL